jgi:hypothetical protein
MLAVILKLVFERTSRGTRITGSFLSSTAKVICTVLPPLFTTCTLFSLNVGATESVTVSLTLPVNVTELCAATLAGTTHNSASSVKI